MDLLKTDEAEDKWPRKLTTNEIRIYNTVAVRVRHMLWGPKLEPTLKAQALTYTSFGTILKMWELADVRSRN